MPGQLSRVTVIDKVANTTIRSVSGILKRIIVGDVGTTFRAIAYTENREGPTIVITTTLANILAAGTAPAATELHVPFNTLRVVTSGTAGQIMVVWE